MHGIVFGELKQYVAETLGPAAWNELAGPKIHLAIREYPDEELGAILNAAAGRTGKTAAALLQAFGDFVGPHLVALYRVYIQPEWTTLDVIEHTEERIHKMVRLQHNGARPPYLSTTRHSENEIVIHYASKRRMCAFAKGIASGIARHYGETLTISELQCMHKGAQTCEIVLRKD